MYNCSQKGQEEIDLTTLLGEGLKSWKFRQHAVSLVAMCRSILKHYSYPNGVA